jgi:hypothetical protein
MCDRSRTTTWWLFGRTADRLERTDNHRLERPEAGVILRGSVRRRLLRQFPYALLYKIKPSGIRILAVMNLKRRPTYWVERE